MDAAWTHPRPGQPSHPKLGSVYPRPIGASRPTWRGLSPAALAWRAGHSLIAASFLAAIAYVWRCALTRRSGPLLKLAVASLIGEGALVAANGGDCPLGPLQDRLGDPVPCFELVLTPRAAKLAVPVLGAVAAAGMVLVVLRPPRQPPSSSAGGSAARSPT
jgi:hypothetical protein